MCLDIRAFFRATDPGKTLIVANPEDKKYYIDFSAVRGEDIIEEVQTTISFSLDEPTCTLFTGHIGCGKSTELRRLQTKLEQDGFVVVYFESSEDLEMADVDISDILLAIARRVSESLAGIIIEEPHQLKGLLEGAMKLLNSEVTGLDLNFKAPLTNQEVGLKFTNSEFSLGFGIGKITTAIKNDANLRTQLNQFLGPQKTQLIDAINRELLEPAIAKLQQLGKTGLVVIVDNLDRIDNRQKPWGRPQPEYLFVDQGDSLNKLKCHLVYTMPLALKFSSDYGNLQQRFREDPQVLPMVPVKMPDGTGCNQGLALLRQMVLARAFPNLDKVQQENKILEIFEDIATLNRLCGVSGGHIRDLLRLLNTWVKKDRKFPLQRATLETVVRDRCNEMMLPMEKEEWELLRQVQQTKQVRGNEGYEILIHSRLVFEYRYNGQNWFDVNPILADAPELQ
ncbi:MAG: ATP-binding protein [Spirulinaceae cyanobacterium]